MNNPLKSDLQYAASSVARELRRASEIYSNQSKAALELADVIENLCIPDHAYYFINSTLSAATNVRLDLIARYAGEMKQAIALDNLGK
jgi:hypothetical protein